MHINDLFTQKKVQINYDRYKKCECVSKKTDCAKCKGKGYSQDLKICASCRGNTQCKQCGDNIITKEKMSIPWSVGKIFKNCQTFKFQNMGNYDFEKEKYSDMFLKLNILTDDNLIINGSSVESTEIIPLTKFVLGGKLEVNTIFGKKEITIGSGMQPDDYKIVDKIV